MHNCILRLSTCRQSRIYWCRLLGWIILGVGSECVSASDFGWGCFEQEPSQNMTIKCCLLRLSPVNVCLLVLKPVLIEPWPFLCTAVRSWFACVVWTACCWRCNASPLLGVMQSPYRSYLGLKQAACRLHIVIFQALNPAMTISSQKAEILKKNEMTWDKMIRKKSEWRFEVTHKAEHKHTSLFRLSNTENSGP
jgi:hypothetical protein